MTMRQALVIGSQLGHRYDRFLTLEPDDRLMSISLEAPWTSACSADVLWATPLSNWRAYGDTPPAGWPGRLRWIQVSSAGIDAFPDWFLSSVPVAATHGNNATSIAEYVILAILAFAKSWDQIRIQRVEDWRHIKQLRNIEGETIAILGLGTIGCAIATRALAMGMKVKGLRKSHGPSPISGVSVCGTMEEAVLDADHVVISLASTPATRHLMGADAFGKMKRGVHFVNIARGMIVDQDALLEALNEGQVAKATLDVTDPEPLPADHPLYLHPNVDVTPHISWSNADHMSGVAQRFNINLRRYRAEESLLGIINREEGY